MKELQIIKEQLQKLLKFGYIYEPKKGEYRSLSKNQYFYLKIEGELK